MGWKEVFFQPTELVKDPYTAKLFSDLGKVTDKGKILKDIKTRTGIDKTRILISKLVIEMKHSERRICKSLGISRSTQRYKSQARDDTPIIKRMEHWAFKYIRAGCEQVTNMIRNHDKIVLNHKKAERIWNETGLKQRRKRKKKRKITGEIVKIRPTGRNQVWSYDFMSWCL